MNKNKKVRKFIYPDSFIKLLGYMRAYFHLPYRQTEGIIRSHAANTLPSIPVYSRIWRRINRLNIKISSDDDDDDKSSLQHDDYFVIAIDSTGVNVTTRGEWIRHKWNIKRGYLKIHVAVDIKKRKTISLVVTSEQVHDGSVAYLWAYSYNPYVILNLIFESVSIKVSITLLTTFSLSSFIALKSFLIENIISKIKEL